MTIIVDNDTYVYRVHSVEIMQAVVKCLLEDGHKLLAIRFVKGVTGNDLATSKSYVEVVEACHD